MKRESMLLLKLCGLVALVAGLVSAGNPTSSAADQPYEVTVERGVAAKMRDGVVLRADIYRPKADGKFPVLLAYPLQQGGRLRVWPESGGARLRRDHPGRARALHLG